MYLPGSPSPHDWGTFRDSTNLLDKYPADFGLGPDSLSTGIGATFIPQDGYSLAEAAAVGGYDHFNWVQGYSDTPNGPLTLDPTVSGCYVALVQITGNTCPNRDTFPWYNDEQYTVDGLPVYDNNHNRITLDPTLQTREEAWTQDPSTLLFSDSPGIHEYFTTCLAGVDSNLNQGGLVSVNDCFSWDTVSGAPSLLSDQALLEGVGNGTLPINFDGFLNQGNAVDVQRFDELQATVASLESVPEPSTVYLIIVGVYMLLMVYVRRTHYSYGGKLVITKLAPL